MKTENTEVVVFKRSTKLPPLYMKLEDNTWRVVQFITNFQGVVYSGYEIFSGFEASVFMKVLFTEYDRKSIEISSETVFSEDSVVLGGK